MRSVRTRTGLSLLVCAIGLTAHAQDVEKIPSPRNIPGFHSGAPYLPPRAGLPWQLQSTFDLLTEHHAPVWTSGHASCGGLDMYEVWQRAQAGPFQATADMLVTHGTYPLALGNVQLVFKTAENRRAYTRLLAQGQALPGFGCWCAYGLGAIDPHLAASNNASITLMKYGERSALFFNIDLRYQGFALDPDACVDRGAIALDAVLHQWLGVTTMRPRDLLFDAPRHVPIVTPKACAPVVGNQ